MRWGLGFVFAIAPSAIASCWDWSELVTSPDATTEASVGFCEQTDATVCVDFDDAQFDERWNTTKYGFMPTYANVEDAQAHSKPSSLFVHIDSGDAGAALYAELALDDAPQYTFGFWLRNEALSVSTIRFFGLDFVLPGDAGEYQLSIGAGQDPTGAQVVEYWPPTYLSHSLADAGITLPLGEWRHVQLTLDRTNEKLTLDFDGEDASITHVVMPVSVIGGIPTPVSRSARLGVFTAPAYVVWAGHYDDFTATF